MFNVRYSGSPKKFLRKADKTIIKRLIEKIEKLRKEPIIHDTNRVGGSKGVFRVRVGGY